MATLAPVGIQSPIPLIYLYKRSDQVFRCWDSVTYPLDILGFSHVPGGYVLGFSHLSP